MVRYFPLPKHDPTGGRIMLTSPYGMRWGRLHAGVDLGSSDGIEQGVPVYAPEDGKITGMGYNPANPSEGRWMWLLQPDGTLWKFFHLQGFQATQHDVVTAGTVIAYVGATGTSAAHLHLERWVGGVSTDPWPYIAEAPYVGEESPVPEEDWLDMATEEEVRQIVRTEVKAALAGLEWAEVAQAMQLTGHGPEGNPTLRDVVERTYNGAVAIGKTVGADPKAFV